MPAHRVHMTVKLSQDARLHSTSHVVSYLLKNAKYDSQRNVLI